jgi:aspartate kinase
MSGETNRLLAMGQQLAAQPSARELDALMATGEQVTIALLSIALQGKGCAAVSYQGWQVAIHTDCVHQKARIEHIDDSRLRADLAAGKVVVVAGFQGVAADASVTTLGRGGSDTTAVALAAALKADECQIFTDVDGVYTTDPRIVPEAHRLDQITFDEMLELASMGSKVLQVRSVEFAGKYAVPLRVLSTFSDGPGTLISYERPSAMERPVISGIAFSKQEALLTLSGVPDKPGEAARIFGALAADHIESDMLTQTPRADGRTDFSFTVARNEAEKAHSALLKACTFLDRQHIVIDNSVAKVSVVGVAMRTHPELASAMFDSLGSEQINIEAITTSEAKITVLVAERDLEQAVRSLHKRFNLDSR